MRLNFGLATALIVTFAVVNVTWVVAPLAHKAHREAQSQAVAPSSDAGSSSKSNAPDGDAEALSQEGSPDGDGEALPDQNTPDGRIGPSQQALSSGIAIGSDSSAEKPVNATHDHDASPSRTVPWPIVLLGRHHPMSTHFPIALLLTAAFAEILFAMTGSQLFRHSVRFMIWGGAIGAVFAAPLGWSLAATGETEQGWVLEAHRWAGTSAAAIGLVVLSLCERAERRDADRVSFRIALAVQAVLIAATGFLGGSLLYGIDHLWRTL